MRAARRRTQSGSALIEFALAFTVMTMLGVGAVSFGLAVQNGIIVADAANSGTLFGANSTLNSTNTTQMQTVAGYAGAGAPSFTSTATYFCACTAGGTGVSCTSACGSDQPLYYVKVATSASFANFFNFAGLPSTLTLKGATIMPVQ
jgi:Flp pilus assembly protein TadG